MDISGILEAEDRLFSSNRADEVEGLLLGGISVALEEQDGGAMLSLLNELIGYYRERGEFEKAYQVAEEIKAVADQILPEKSIPYATSLLNIATAYRAGGKHEEAATIYKQVEDIYKEILEPDNMLMASLYNNESLLYQEMGDFATSKIKLESALSIVTLAGEKYEEAVSRANLAGTCMQLGELSEGFDNACKSIEIFSELEVFDAHYAAALSAKGSYYYINGEFDKGAETFYEAMEIMEKSLGKNGFYERLLENYEACKEASKAESIKRQLAENIESENTEALAEDDTTEKVEINKDSTYLKGLDICKQYYEQIGEKALKENFPEYFDKLEIGLCGEGSDCFGFDDEISRDHDFGPEFCIFVSDEIYEKIGTELQEVYNSLPDTFSGVKRASTVNGSDRRGVIKISDFCKRMLGTDCIDSKEIRDSIDWREVSDASLAAFVNGKILKKGEGILSSLREEVAKGYPENIWYLKISESCAKFSQAGQYNILRAIKREDTITAHIMQADAFREAMKLVFYINNVFPLHDKWLSKAMLQIDCDEAYIVKNYLEEILKDDIKEAANGFEKVAELLAFKMYEKNIISDIDTYLDHHTEELLMKSLYASNTDEELVMRIAKAEFAAFDKVRNEGGRASCQNDWPTFSIMRRSQYMTWNRDMLLQYLYDFEREIKRGHNLITEKYGRMMESTAPERYAEIKDNFPEISDEKKAIIETVVGIQIKWMEEFSNEHPALASQARTVHTYDDKAYDTSYETYLRGEISTYSDKMLQLYAWFIVNLTSEGKNLAYMTMENSCKLYGYGSLEDAEKAQIKE